MSRAQPTPTRFPYTTLFRSVFYARCKSPRHGLTIHAYPLNHITKTAMQSTSESTPANSRSRVLFASLVGTTIEDRKSTRLNSSHVRISYAVFCLKKKTHDTA